VLVIFGGRFLNCLMLILLDPGDLFLKVFNVSEYSFSVTIGNDGWSLVISAASNGVTMSSIVVMCSSISSVKSLFSSPSSVNISDKCRLNCCSFSFFVWYLLPLSSVKYGAVCLLFPCSLLIVFQNLFGSFSKSKSLIICSHVVPLLSYIIVVLFVVVYSCVFIFLVKVQ